MQVLKVLNPLGNIHMLSLLKVIYNDPSLFQKFYLLNHLYIEKMLLTLNVTLLRIIGHGSLPLY
jgi:hypothetical protein